MRCRARYLLAPSLALVLTGPALAQRPPSPDSSPAAPTQSPFAAPLYRTPEVTRSLNMTPAQINQLNAAIDRLQSRYRTDAQRLGSLSSDVRAQRTSQLQRSYNDDLLKATGGVLDRRQMNRYRQLELQSRGFDAFLDPTVQRQLNLTADQQRQLRTLATQTNRQLQALRPLTGEADQTQRQRAEIRARALGGVNDLLTPQQRQAWTGMIGQRFNFPPATQPRR